MADEKKTYAEIVADLLQCAKSWLPETRVLCWILLCPDCQNTQPCGHPKSSIVSSGEGTHYCGDCQAEGEPQ